MPLPTERISLNNRETAVVLSGLNRIVDEFSTLQVTGRRAPDIINPWLKDKLQPRVLAPGTYESILSLRNRLASVAREKRMKFRFTPIEYAILAFAVRVARRHRLAGTTANLEGKLEIYRKRAKRKAIRLLGHPDYESAAQSWLCSLRWIRFNLLPLSSARPSSGKLRICREQYNSLLRIAKAALADRCTEPLREDLVCKLVELAAAEIRRGLHSGVRVRELIADPANGKEFLFDFISKRAEKRNVELHLKPEHQPLCVQTALRGERFKAALTAQASARLAQAEASASVPAVTAPVAVQPHKSEVAHVPTTIPTLTAECVSAWLTKYVKPAQWAYVVAKAHSQLPHRNINSQTFATKSIEAAQQACRPMAESCDVTKPVNLAVDWLIDWALILEQDKSRIHEIFDAGLIVAKSNHKPAIVRRPKMDGCQFIREIMNGNLAVADN